MDASVTLSPGVFAFRLENRGPPLLLDVYRHSLPLVKHYIINSLVRREGQCSIGSRAQHTVEQISFPSQRVREARLSRLDQTNSFQNNSKYRNPPSKTSIFYRWFHKFLSRSFGLFHFHRDSKMELEYSRRGLTFLVVMLAGWHVLQ